MIQYKTCLKHLFNAHLLINSYKMQYLCYKRDLTSMATYTVCKKSAKGTQYKNVMAKNNNLVQLKKMSFFITGATI